MGRRVRGSRIVAAELILLTTLALAAPAAEVDPEADALAAAVEASFRGFGGLRMTASLTVGDGSGEKVYRFTELAKESPDGLRMMIRFAAPPTIAGTAVLTREPHSGTPETWLYLAGSGHVKKVTGTERHNTLLGSELTFEQLSVPRAADYRHRRLGEDRVGDRPCVELEQRPRRARERGHVVTCIDVERKVPLRARYFDATGAVTRTIEASRVEESGGRWRPHRLDVTNARTGRRSRLEIESLKLGLELGDELFTVGQLRR